METELHYIDDHGAASWYATGCLFVAMKERVLDFDTGFAVFLWSIAAASVAFALFHIHCATLGAQVLFGRPDGFLDPLVRGGHADATLIDSYRDAMPIVIGCLLWLGLSHLAAAYFLIRRDLRGFLIAWCSALVSAVAAVSIQLSIVWSDEPPSEFMALLMQAATLTMLVHWSNRRHRHPGRKT